MADIKATSFRVSEEDIAKFKEFADKEGYNQAEAFKSIMQTLEMAKAKNIIKDRAKEVEVFQDTINDLMGYFLNSLNVNQTSEERIREELSKELITKDNTISTMYEQLQDLKADKINSDNNFKEIDIKNKELQEQLQKSINDNLDKQSQLDIANRNNNNLQDQVAEYKQYKHNYKTIEKDLEQLKAEHEELKDTNNKLNNDNVLLNDKVKNNSDMIEFYKSNNIELKANIKSLEDKYNNDIKSLEEQHKQQVLDVKDLYKDTLDNKINELNNKNDIEVAKKDLEIEKLQNEISKMKTKPTTQKSIK